MLTRSVLLLAFLIIPVAQAEDPLPIEKLIGESVVIDGVANVYSPESGIGQPDFTKDREGKSVKAATGIDFGTQTVHDEKQLDRQMQFAAGKWKGARVILAARDIDACLADKQFGVLLYAQVHFPLQGNANAVKRWHVRGLRILNLQYGSTDKNQAEEERLCGAFDQKGGLTKLGQQVVGACFALGIIIDLSHCNEETTIEVAKLAKARRLPILKNHTAARGALREDGELLADFERNASDAELKAVASTGGVAGIMAYAPYLRRRGPATVADYVTHIEHAVRIAGIDHVGIATDGYLDGTMSNNTRADRVLDSPRRWFEVVKLLRQRGYTDEQLRKLLGGNFLRAYRAVLK